MSEREPELRGGLTVNAQRRSPLARGRRIPQDRLGVAGRVGVVGQTGRVDRPGRRRRERPEHLAVERYPPVGGDRVFDRKPRQLVSERDRRLLVDQHSGVQTRLELREVHAADGFEQPQLSPCGDDRGGLEQPARRRRERRRPREHRVAHGFRDVRVHRGQRLGDEERVPAGPLEQPRRVHPGRLGQRPDRLERQRLDLAALSRGRARQLAEHDLQRAVRSQLIVAERDEREHGQRRDPAAEQLDDVERPLVGPVDVLDHEHRRGLVRQFGDERSHELVRHPPVGRKPTEVEAGVLRDVEERPECARREQPLARAPQHSGSWLVRAELAEQRGLADARLASQKHHPPTAVGRLGEPGGEIFEQLGAFEELEAILVRSRFSNRLAHHDPPAPAGGAGAC